MKCFPKISAHTERATETRGRQKWHWEGARERFPLTRGPLNCGKVRLVTHPFSRGATPLPSAGACSLNSARLIRIYLTSVGRHLHSLQNCTNNSRAQAAVRTKGTFNGKRGCTRVRLPWANKATQTVAITVQVIKSLLMQRCQW